MEEKNGSNEPVFPSWSYTHSFTTSIRGVAPQHLLDTATRHSIYQSVFWNQYCFGVNLVTLIDRVQNLKGVGGVYGMFREPSNFICLFLKLLELEPSKEVIYYILNTKSWQNKHLRLLAALYVRFVFPPEEVYLILEDQLTYYFKIAVLREDGYHVEHYDEVINSFLNDKFWCGITFPPLTPRLNLPPRQTPLAHMIEKLKIEEFDKKGLTPDGELKEIVEERKLKEAKTGKLKFKVKKKVSKKSIPKEQEKTKFDKEDEEEIQNSPKENDDDDNQSPIPHDVDLDDVESQNKVRALLGLPLLEE